MAKSKIDLLTDEELVKQLQKIMDEMYNIAGINLSFEEPKPAKPKKPRKKYVKKVPKTAKLDW